MKVKLYLFLGLFFTVTPVLAVDPITAIGMGVSFISSIFGGAAARRQQRQAERLRRRQENQVKALEANRQDIPDFGQDLENPFANLQIATRAAEMQAEQQDISLASTLDVLRATGASAGGATALARAASQSKRGVAAQIEKQEARNAQLRAQGELQSAALRQRGQQLEFAAGERREMQQLNRASSLASSASQQAAAYGAQANAMFGQAVGTLGTFAAAGGFGKSGPFASTSNTVTNAAGQQVAMPDLSRTPQSVRFDQLIDIDSSVNSLAPNNLAGQVMSGAYSDAVTGSVITPNAPISNVNMAANTQVNPYNTPIFGNTIGNDFINNLSQFGLTNQQLSALGGFRF